MLFPTAMVFADDSIGEPVGQSSDAPIFGQRVSDELVLGDHSLAVHGDLEDRTLYFDDAKVEIDGMVPWWVSGIEKDNILHLVVGDAAYRTLMTHYIISYDGGATWTVLETFRGFAMPRISIHEDSLFIEFERNLYDGDKWLFELADGEFERVKDNPVTSYAGILDYRTTVEYKDYDIARKSEFTGRPAGSRARAPAKEWAYIYVCNGEASGIEAFLEADANEMAAGGSSDNHWAICLFDDDGAGTNEIRVMDVGGGGYTSFTMAEVGLPPEPNLGDTSTYVTFLDWCFTNYPGNRVVWDSGGHGGGTTGCIFDETPVDDISLTEITVLTDDLMTTLGRPFDVICWDTCITMTEEWLYGYKPITDYTIASMDNIVGAGFNYENLMDYLASTVPTPEEMAHEVAVDYWTGESAYISALNMNNWDYVFWPTFNNLCQEITHGSYTSQVSTAWSNAFYPGTAPNHDVWEWMDNINSGISDPTIQALAIQARDQVWTANYPAGLNDVVLVEYGSDASHHGLGDERQTDSGWQIDIETMRNEMITVSGVSNNIPSCIIDSPTEASDVTMNGSLTIQGTASDTDGTISKVEVKINKEWWQLASGTGSWSFDWDVASDASYYGLGPYKIWARSFDGTDYSNWECVNVNVVESYGPAGIIELDREVYPLEDTVAVTVKDGDLTAPSITVDVTSTSEPSGETVTLLAGAVQGRYDGTITISATDGAGVLQVSDSDLITATYDDADDGSGSPATATDTATVDGQAPEPPTSLTVEWFGGARSTIWIEDFEGDGSPTFAELGWTPGGGSNDWELDTPSGMGTPADPPGPSSGSFSIGNDLTGLGLVPGEYESSLTANSNYIYSPPIDCTGYTDVYLNFDRWLGVESSTFDHASIQVSTDAIAWDTVWDHSGSSFTDTVWTLTSYNISAWADNQPAIYIRYDMGPTDTSVEYCGWNIDDMYLDGTIAGGTIDNKLQWTLSLDDGAGDDDVVQYNIYRADNSGGPWDAGALIATVPDGTNSYIDPGCGEPDGTNWWYVVRAEDWMGNEELNIMAVPEIPVTNMPPTAPSDPTPPHNAVGVSLNPTLSVKVLDPNADIMDVYFYDASGPLIGTDTGVTSGTYASVPWNGLAANTVYDWYAIADDGTLQTQSPTWSFETIDQVPPGAPSGLTVEWWGVTSQTWIDEDFSGGVPPAGWTQVGPSNQWSQSATTYAGGTSPEAMFSWVSNTGFWHLYAGPFDTTGITTMDLQWRNMINDYGLEATHAYCSVQTSTDAVTWSDTGWFYSTGSGDMPASLETITVDTDDVGSPTFYIGWTLDGNAYDIDYWYIDDVLLTSTGGGTTDDNWLNWTLSGDDGAGTDDVAQYNIYRADNSGGPWDGTAFLDSVPDGTDTYMDYGAGETDGNTWWYVVRAEDVWGNEDTNTFAVPEPGVVPQTYDINVELGWNFVSFPIALSGVATSVLDDSYGDGLTTWDCLRYYDAFDGNDHWKCYMTDVPSMADMPVLDNTMGVWIRITALGDGVLTVGSGPDDATTDIGLKTGWNMVSYPANTEGYTVGQLKTDYPQITAVEGFGPGLYNIQVLGDSYVLRRGEGYWFFTTTDVIVTFDW